MRQFYFTSSVVPIIGNNIGIGRYWHIWLHIGIVVPVWYNNLTNVTWATGVSWNITCPTIMIYMLKKCLFGVNMLNTVFAIGRINPQHLMTIPQSGFHKGISPSPFAFATLDNCTTDVQMSYLLQLTCTSQSYTYSSPDSK